MAQLSGAGDKDLRLSGNIVMPGSWRPYTASGTIILDGGGYTITTGRALFQSVGPNSSFRDINLNIVYHGEASEDYYGGFIIDDTSADVKNFFNCTVKGQISIPDGASSAVKGRGGFCGRIESGIFVNCKNYCVVSNCTNAAGIAGFSSTSAFIECRNEGTIGMSGNGVYNCGGICAVAYDSCFTECVNMPHVYGLGNAGGIAAIAYGCAFRGCTNNGGITSDAARAADSADTYRLGGIVGQIYDPSVIIDCVNNGFVGTRMKERNCQVCGGIVGAVTEGFIFGNMNKGKIDSGDGEQTEESALGTGGIVGVVEGIGNTLIDRNTDSGSVSGKYNSGGIVGGIGYVCSGEEITIRKNTVCRDARIEAHYSGAAGILGGVWVSDTEGLHVDLEDNLVGAEMISAMKNAHRIFGGYFDSDRAMHDPLLLIRDDVKLSNNSALDDETMLNGESFDAASGQVFRYNKCFIDTSDPWYQGDSRGWNGGALEVDSDTTTMSDCLHREISVEAACGTRNANLQGGLLYSDGGGGVDCRTGNSTSLNVYQLDTTKLVGADTSNIKINFYSPNARIPAEGVEFRLVRDNGTVVGDFTTGENGELIACGIAPGLYRLEPVLPSSGGWIPHERYIVQVGLGGSVRVDGSGSAATVNQDPTASGAAWSALNPMVQDCVMSGMSILP
jgi:hypothetical protein